MRELVRQHVEQLVELIRREEEKLLELVEKRQERGRRELEGELRRVEAVLRRMEAGERLVAFHTKGTFLRRYSFACSLAAWSTGP